jgi:ParB-like chromosome segregation protein Spo0J
MLKPSGVVHPATDLFPMMSDEELDELAGDITTHGLLHPIVLDAEGTLIDGRNRLAACQRAGVRPRFTMLDGKEPVAYILATNVNRRHLSAGQRAMLVAKARSLASKDQRDGRKARSAESANISAGRISQAVIVLEFAPELADQVIAGASLDQAYAEAARRKREPEERAERERRAAEIEEKRRQRVELALEEIGPEISIRSVPDLLVELDQVPGPSPDVAMGLAEQEHLLQRLGAIKRELQMLAQEKAIYDGLWLEGYVMGVRAAISQIVDAAYLIAEQHNRLLDHPQLRSVR